MSSAGIAARPAMGVAGRVQTIAVLAVTAVLIGAAAWFIGKPATGGFTSVELTGDTSGPAVRVGDVPPNFTAKTLDGTQVSLADYAGRPVWLTFGATWCPDCRVEALDLEATYEAYRDRGLVVLAVFLRETGDEVRSYADRVGFTFPMVPDPGTIIASRYRVLGLPTHYFIGPDGRVDEVRIGALQATDMDRFVAGLFD
jgi:cytochrome c biogenesis protein CcmG/thiol:disulfide interchange protein DsbE